MILPNSSTFPAAALIFAGICCGPSRAQLAAYYPLNETSGNVANDASGNNRHATSTVAGGNNWQAAGIIGGAVRFTPTAQADVDEAFVHASAANITTAYPVSMAVWFQTGFTAAANQTLMNFSGNTTSNSRYYSILLSSATGNPLAGQARTTANFTANSSTSVNNGQWRHAAWVLAADNLRTLYLDGMAVATDLQVVASLASADSPRKFGIGALMRSSNTASYTDAFTGMMDEAGFWLQSLTAVDVALIHALGRYDQVPLNSPSLTAARAVFETQAGTVQTGTVTWSYVTGLVGAVGASGLSGANPWVVLDAQGNGLTGVRGDEDADDDGMKDTWETANGLNPAVNDAAGDPDNDGLTNLNEHSKQTNPQVADTDADGLNDGPEVNTHLTDPLDDDTDNDGLKDGAEVNTHHTSPLQADTDNDAFSDPLELLEGTDPAAAASFPAPVRLALHWPLNEGTGTTATDDSQDILTPAADFVKNRHGQYVSFSHAAGAPVWRTSGGVNNSGFLHFDGNKAAGTGYAMRYEEAGGVLPAGFYSISAWFRITADETGTGFWTIAAALNSTVNTEYYSLGKTPSTGSVHVYHRNGGNGILEAGPLNYADGKWHHLAGVFQANDLRYLYLDGVLLATGTGAATAVVNPTRFSIGMLDRLAPTDYLGADIDEVSLYIGALTPLNVAALFAHGQQDSDGDGLADTWEISHGFALGPNESAADADGDGRTNLQEQREGTDPNNIASRFALTPVVQGGDVALSLDRATGRAYQIQSSPDLSQWSGLLDIPAGPGGPFLSAQPMAPGRQFYRAQIVPPQ